MSPPAPPDLLLALDTSGDVCSVALFRKGMFHAELAFRHEMHLSERLIGHVDLLLKEIGAVLSEVDCYSVGIGPGSFTGTRIGVMTAKTFAFVQSRPIFAINGLEAMASEYSGVHGLTVVPILTCRTGTVYACPYDVSRRAPISLAEPGAYSFNELAALIPDRDSGPLLFCGPAAHRYEVDLRASLEERGAEVALGSVEFPRASAVGRLALWRLEEGALPVPVLEVTPLYISPPPITMPRQPIPI